MDATEMELAGQIKKHRQALGISQEALAEKIYVSRQTISNWETARTYPDVQSLLLLSVAFVRKHKSAHDMLLVTLSAIFGAAFVVVLRFIF